ncbi:MAG TPA: transcriptional repressor [Clostridiales bacterium]|nr:transcriptional repressor [Clostridiales bacterium]
MKQRNTKQRQLVLDAVRGRCDHPSADQIYLTVRGIDNRISRGTVYRNLNVLVQQGEILHVKLPHTDRFESRLDNHYHLLCTGCGAVSDVPLPYRGELDEQTAKETGYTIERHRAVFEGLCPACRQRKEESKGTAKDKNGSPT